MIESISINANKSAAMNEIKDTQVIIRNTIKPGDLGSIVKLHGEYYSTYHGFDSFFEPYVAVPLSEFVLRNSKRERIWIVEFEREVKGCIAVVENKNNIAQLRWFIIDTVLQGKGIGKKLIQDLLQFVKQQGYVEIILWTVTEQEKAIEIYAKNGFTCIKEKYHKNLWGKEITELCFSKVLKE